MLLRFASALVICTLTVAACAQQRSTDGTAPSGVQQSLTAPTSVSPVSEAKTIASQLNFSVDPLTVPAYPACPLTPPGVGPLIGSGVLTIVVRTTTAANGGTHLGVGIHGHGKATDVNGGAWTWTDADLNNEVVGLPTGNTSNNVFEQTITESFHVVGPQGQKIRIKGTFHVTVVNGTTVVEFEKGNETAANEPCEGGFNLVPLP